MRSKIARLIQRVRYGKRAVSSIVEVRLGAPYGTGRGCIKIGGIEVPVTRITLDASASAVPQIRLEIVPRAADFTVVGSLADVGIEVNCRWSRACIRDEDCPGLREALAKREEPEV